MTCTMGCFELMDSRFRGYDDKDQTYCIVMPERFYRASMNCHNLDTRLRGYDVTKRV